jgi:hypothetical protein
MKRRGFGEGSERPRLTPDLCDYPRGNSVTYRVYDVLGIPGNTIPRGMQGRFNVDGHTVVVKAAGPRRHRRSGFSHRMFFDVNGRLIPVGRVHQALCKKHGGGMGGCGCGR